MSYTVAEERMQNYIEELEQENRLLRARNDRLEAEAKAVSVQEPVGYADSRDLAKDGNWDTLIVKHASEMHEGLRFNVPLYTTPPAARPAPVQEPMTWVERWYGSGPDQGWWIWERHSLTHGQAVARIGSWPFAERLTSIIVEKHNAALFPTELVKEPFAPDPHNGTGPTPTRSTEAMGWFVG